MVAVAELCCPKCKKRYAAGSNLAGKHVKCRACGTLFCVPGPKPADESTGARTSQGGNGRVASASGEPNFGSCFDGSASRAAGIRLNTKHKFPTAATLDRWLPATLITAAVLWILRETLADHRAGATWVWLLRFPILLLLYFKVITSLSLFGFKRAASALRFELPPNAKWRMAAVCAMPVALGYALWMVSGASGALIGGLVAGLVLTAPAFWLLLRPRDAEIVPSATATCAGFIIGVCISGVVLLLIGSLVNVAMEAYHVADRLQGNPMGPSFSWKVTPKAPPLEATPDAPSPTTEPAAAPPQTSS